MRFFPLSFRPFNLLQQSGQAHAQRSEHAPSRWLGRLDQGGAQRSEHCPSRVFHPALDDGLVEVKLPPQAGRASAIFFCPAFPKGKQGSTYTLLIVYVPSGPEDGAEHVR